MSRRALTVNTRNAATYTQPEILQGYGTAHGFMDPGELATLVAVAPAVRGLPSVADITASKASFGR